MSRDRRVLDQVFQATASAGQTGMIVFTFEGKNSAGKDAAFKVNLPWWIWPIIAKQILRAWLSERLSREKESDNIESHLPKEFAA